MNRVCLVGRITKDPELKYTSSGIPNVFFTLAVNRNRTDANGDRQADFISCTAWRASAEFIAKYIKKGYQLSVEGRIQTRNWTDNNNQIHYMTEIVCDSVNNLTPRQQTGESSYQPSNQGNYNNSNRSGYSSNYNSNNNSGYSTGNSSYNRETTSSYQQKPNSNYNNKESFNVTEDVKSNVKTQNDDSQSFNVNVIDDDLPF